MVETPEVLDADPPQRLSHETLDQILEWILAAHPDAPIGAVTADGLNTELPDGFDPGPRRVMPPGGSAISYVPPEQLADVIDAWHRAREHGASRSVLGSDEDPDGKLTLYLVDATHRHGVYLSMPVGGRSIPAPGDELQGQREPTRLGRLQKDQFATIIDADEGAFELLGFSPGEIVGRRSLELIHPDDHARAVDCWMAMLADPGGLRTVRYRHLRRDGSYVWCDVSHRNLLEAAEGRVVADLVDVSSEMEATEALREREQLLTRLTEEIPLGVLQIDAARNITFANQRFYEILGAKPNGDIVEHIANVLDDDRSILMMALDRVLDHGNDENLRLRVRRPGDDQHRLVQVALRALTGDDGQVSGAVSWVDDVTESVLLAMELETRATRDALTGCFNRASMMAALEELLDSDLHLARGTALLFFDVDRFKEVNDDLGHAAGDQVLRSVVERAASVIREHDVLGRLGGDEFLVVCPGMSDERRAMGIAGRMSEVVNRPIAWGGQEIDLRISIGVVWCDDPRVDPDWLIAQADRVMYESKRDGSGRPIGKPARARGA